MQPFLDALEQRLSAMSRRAGIKVFLGLIAVILVLFGLGFLTVALWLVARDTLGPMIGALVLGLGFTLLGLIILAVGMRRRPVPAPVVSVSVEAASVAALIEAFMVGLRAGKDARSPKEDQKD